MQDVQTHDQDRPSCSRDDRPATADATNEACLDRYARILVEHAIGLREGQPLFIYCELIHRDFALRVGEAAYNAGAGQVRYRLVDPLEAAQLIRRGRQEQIALFYVEYQAWLADLLRSRGALLLLDGKSDPELLPELQRKHPQKHLFFSRESSTAALELGRRVLEQRLSPAVIAVFPTPAWARRVFPDLPTDEAFRRLSELVFRFTYADQADALARATAERQRIEARRAALDALGIREIRVTGGGNDLRVGLSAQSRWRDGSFSTTTGQRFLANVPSFEIYTTPDRRLTEGRLVASRPIRLQGGTVVDGLVLDFRHGRVVAFEAGRSAEAFGRWLDVDGACYLGEFALVGEDTPIARCGREFEHTLLDENAAAHVALGQGLPAALDGGETMSPDELEAVGCNRSGIHTDIPFGSAQVKIVATESQEGEVALLEQGHWTAPFGSPSLYGA